MRFSQFLVEGVDINKPLVWFIVRLRARSISGFDPQGASHIMDSVLSKVNKKITGGLQFYASGADMVDDDVYDVDISAQVDTAFSYKSVDMQKFQKSINTLLMKGGHEAISEFISEGLSLTIFDVPKFNIEIDYAKFIGVDSFNPSLRGIHKALSAETFLVLNARFIRDGGIGLLLVKRLQDLRINEQMAISGTFSTKWGSIIMRHFHGDKDVLDCQEELIKNGFKEFAKL